MTNILLQMGSVQEQYQHSLAKGYCTGAMANIPLQMGMVLRDHD